MSHIGNSSSNEVAFSSDVDGAMTGRYCGNGSLSCFASDNFGLPSSDNNNVVGGGEGCWTGFSPAADRYHPQENPPLNQEGPSQQSTLHRLGASVAATIRKRQHAHKANNNDVEGDNADGEEDIAVTMGKAFSKLSVQERNVITEEIHGVVNSGGSNQNDPEADDEYVDCSIQRLHEEIQNMPTKNKTEYKRACFLAPTKYETNQKFNLMFLRSARYDPKLAAEKMVGFFKLKSQLFGSDMVAHDITWDDLGKEEQACFGNLNSVMFLPLPDMAGRKILIGTSFDVHPEIKARAEFWYIMKEIENDEMAQKHGVIALAYDVGVKFAIQSKCAATIISDVYKFLPFKFTSFHYCYSNPALRVTFSMFLRLLKKYIGARFREHYGNHIEVHYSLMGYGIPVSVFPINQEGQVQSSIIWKQIEKVRVQEKEHLQKQHRLLSTSSYLVQAATSKDVLLGRGVPIQSHPGNVGLSALITRNREEYMDTSRTRKTEITWSIVHDIQNKVGGRFLEKDDTSGMWKVVHDDLARNKVAVGFRSQTKMDKKRQKGQMQQQQRRKQQHTIAKNNITGGNYPLTSQSQDHDEAMVLFDSLFQADHSILLTQIENDEFDQDFGNEIGGNFKTWWSLFDDGSTTEGKEAPLDGRNRPTSYDPSASLAADKKRR